MFFLKSISKLTLLVVLTLSLTYCGKPVDVTSLYDLSKDADKVPPYMIEGLVTNGIGPHYVKITKPVAINATRPTYVTNAFVTISDDRGNSEMLAYDGNGKYLTTTLTGVNDGRTYTMHVNVDGKSYSASSIMPATSLPIDSLVSVQDDSGLDEYKVLIFANVNVHVPEYYVFHFFRNDTLIDETTSLFQSNNSQLNGKIPGISFSGDFKKGDKATVEFYSVSKDADTFYLGFANQLSSDGGTFGTPPANVKGNIPGALGLFHAAYLRKVSTVVR